MAACVDQELLLGAVVDNELDAANVAMVEAHAARCEGCREELDRLQAVLGTYEIRAILRSGLHEFLDSIQRQLMAVTRELSIAFFGYTPGAQQAQTANSQ